jgi:hypothetical protein
MMAQQPTSLLVENDQPLIGVVLEENGHEVIRYFADEAVADAVTANAGTQAALGAIGAWSDMDWEEIEAELGCIRHASRPTTQPHP